MSACPIPLPRYTVPFSELPAVFLGSDGRILQTDSGFKRLLLTRREPAKRQVPLVRLFQAYEWTWEDVIRHLGSASVPHVELSGNLRRSEGSLVSVKCFIYLISSSRDPRYLALFRPDSDGANTEEPVLGVLTDFRVWQRRLTSTSTIELSGQLDQVLSSISARLGLDLLCSLVVNKQTAAIVSYRDWLSGKVVRNGNYFESKRPPLQAFVSEIGQGEFRDFSKRQELLRACSKPCVIPTVLGHAKSGWVVRTFDSGHFTFGLAALAGVEYPVWPDSVRKSIMEMADVISSAHQRLFTATPSDERRSLTLHSKPSDTYLPGELPRHFGRLTPQEVRVSNLVRKGLSSKEIAAELLRRVPTGSEETLLRCLENNRNPFFGGKRGVKSRYVGLEGGFVIDMGHLMRAAAEAHNLASKYEWAPDGLIWDAVSLGGIVVEFEQAFSRELGLRASAFSWEDLSSNTLGIYFALVLYDPDRPLWIQMQEFLKRMKAVSPEEYEELHPAIYNAMPKDEEEARERYIEAKRKRETESRLDAYDVEHGGPPHP